MKKLLIPSIFFVLLISFSFAQKPYKVVFYNIENFFDTINDPEVLDDLKNGIQPNITRSSVISNGCFLTSLPLIKIIRL